MARSSKNKQLLFFFTTLAITNLVFGSLVNQAKAIRSHLISTPDPNPINDFDYSRAFNTYRNDKRNIQTLKTDHDPDHSIQEKSFMKMPKKADPSFRELRSDQHNPARNKRFASFSLFPHALGFNLRKKQFFAKFERNDVPVPLIRKSQRRQLEYEPKNTNHDLNTMYLLPETSKKDSFQDNFLRITKKSTIEPNQVSNEEHKEQQLLTDYIYFKHIDQLINRILNRNSDDPNQAIDEMTPFINQAVMPKR